MAKTRVNKLALELGLQNDQIIEALQKKGVAVLNHMSSVDEEVAQNIRDLFAPKAPEKTAPKTVKIKAKTKIKIKAPSKVKITTDETDWYENGKKKSEGSCKDGKKNGLWTWWYENGDKELEKNYIDNKLDGLSTSWYENGEKRSEQNFKNGKKVGPYTKWDTEIFNDGKIEDPVVTQLKTITDFNGSFNYKDIREIAIPKVNVHSELGKGRAILDTPDKLDQYWQSLGPMIKSQWKNIFDMFKFVDSSNSGIEIIDYGCGQGLASLLFLHEYYSGFKKDISKITLIDLDLPSLALPRAKIILECYSSDIQIVAISKDLDELETKDLETDQNLTKIHLFSNILDVDSFDIVKLFNKILKNTGDHTFLIVSHDRDFEGGSPRLKAIYEGLISIKHDHLKINFRSDVIQFNCSNPSQSRAIFFVIDLTVLG